MDPRAIAWVAGLVLLGVLGLFASLWAWRWRQRRRLSPPGEHPIVEIGASYPRALRGGEPPLGPIAPSAHDVDASRTAAPLAPVRAEPFGTEPLGPSPVVLCHGMLGFDLMFVGGVPIFYFRGIPMDLHARGERVLLARVPPLAPIAVRAAALARQIETIDAPRVNLIAHSMGGLDARYAIAKLGIAHRVASLTTIGTPHRGTPLVDRTRLLTTAFKRPIAATGGDVDAFFDLSTERMVAFNDVVRDAPGVRYFSVAGRAGRDGSRVSPPLWLGHRVLGKLGAESDGLVPVSSQLWGDVLRIVPADHLAQIGWSRGFDARGLFNEIIKHLREQGL